MDGNGYWVQVKSDGTVEMGLMHLLSDLLAAKHSANRERRFDDIVSFRLLA